MHGMNTNIITRFVTSLFLALAFLLPHASFAYTPYETQYRAQLIATIQLLQQQIQALQAIVDARNEVAPATSRSHVGRSTDRVADVDFYDGDYRAIYKVQSYSDIDLIHGRTGSYDDIMWDRLVAIASADFIEDYVREFRTYNDADAPHDAFVYRYNTEAWVFAINLHIITPMQTHTDYERLRDLLLHEFAHILFTEEYQWAEEQFADIFWDAGDYRHAKKVAAETDNDERWDRLDNYYKKNEDEFVSAYATSNYHEDVAETFVHFVLRNRPQSDDRIEEKIDFMYDIDGLRELRKDIRDDLDI
jgi:hypothetical protein